MTDLSHVSTYLQAQNITLDAIEILNVINFLQLKKFEDSITPDRILRYPVPKLGDNGSCSLIDELEDEPYDLSFWFNHDINDSLKKLTDISNKLKAANEKISADWLGVYAVGVRDNAPQLVKLVYTGIPSRAEFPLNEEFAKISNNSRVGLSGIGAVIHDVPAWCEALGSYYTCDTSINSEVCLPIINQKNEVIGIIDAEAKNKKFFDENKLTWLIAFTIVLSESLEKLHLNEI